MSSSFRGSVVQRFALATLVLASAPLAVTGPADARAGGGFSFGSRGGRTFSMPAPTQTAPRPAQSLGRPDAPSYGQPAPQRRFGFGSGLLAGLLGAGLMGSLFGSGFFGGIAAFVGLLFKLALVGGAIFLILRLFRGRRAALASGPSGFAPMARGGGPLPGGAPVRSVGTPATIEAADYVAFEQSLGAVQEAYSREDVGALGRLATPEMVRGLSADIATNARRGVRNDVSQARLVRGDLSEAWSEGGATYATVAMRFAAVDVMIDRASGRVVSGDPVRPVEATELWTFRRDGGGPWLLSAIQQES